MLGLREALGLIRTASDLRVNLFQPSWTGIVFVCYVVICSAMLVYKSLPTFSYHIYCLLLLDDYKGYIYQAQIKTNSGYS